MKIKKIAKTILLLGIIGGCIAGSIALYNGGQVASIFKTESKPKEKPIWLADSPAPKTVKPGAYLAVLNATLEEDLERAAHFYLKTLEGDPQNTKLQQEGYFFNAILGNLDALRPVVQQLPSTSRVVLLTDYVKAGYAFKDKRWKDVRQELLAQEPLPLDEIVHPLLFAWSYAGEGNFEEALKALEPLKQRKKLDAYYYYHKGLIALSLGKDLVADEAFQSLAQNKLPTFSLYPEIQTFYIQRLSWRSDNPFYIQWQLFNAEQPATAELIMLPKSRPVTAIRGAAEAFYNISTGMGGGQDGFEEALILSALSLYLNPDQELPKIWSAEILEQNKKPLLAAYYYNKLKAPLTQTIAFKKANNLIGCGREKEALPILLGLKKTNRNSEALWFALAQVYQSEKWWDAATQAYTQILNIADKTNRAYLSDVYFARAFTFAEQKLTAEAEADLQKAVELNPENPMLLNHLGYQWAERDDTFNKGAELVEKAYKLNSIEPHIIDSMAYVYYRKKEYEKALPLAEKTVDIMPQSSVTNAHLGDIYWALGRHREAVFQYQKALVLKYDLTPELKQELLDKISQNQRVVVKKGP